MAKSIRKKMTAPRKKTAPASFENMDNAYAADSSSNYSSSKKTSRLAPAGSGDFNVKEIVQQLMANPTVRYIAVGLATTLVAKISSKLSGRYPEISTFVKESFPNFDLEEKIKQFKDGQGGSSGVAH